MIKARPKGTKNWQNISKVILEDTRFYVKAEDLEFDCEPNKSEIDWEQVRVQAAISAMRGILANYSLAANGNFIYDGIVKTAVGYAEDLVAELQKTKRE